MSGIKALKSAQFITIQNQRLVVLAQQDWDALVAWLETLMQSAPTAEPARKRDTQQLQALFKQTQATPQAQIITEEEIAAEIAAYRNGQ